MNATIQLLKTYTTAQLNKSCIYPCISPQYCAERCLLEQIRFHYEFVWFFVLAFLFSEFRSIPYLINDMDIKLQNKISRGFRLASYILNLSGILYFLVVVL